MTLATEDGIIDIEGKAATGSGERLGKRASFNSRLSHSAWRHGSASDLHRQPTTISKSGRNSWRSFHRQHRIQRVLDSETRYPFRRAILHQPPHRAYVRARSRRRRDSCVCRSCFAICCNRTSFPAVTTSSRAAELFAAEVIASSMSMR